MKLSLAGEPAFGGRLLVLAVAGAVLGGCMTLPPQLDQAHPLSRAHQVAEDAERAADRRRTAVDDDPGMKLISKGFKAVFGSPDDKPRPNTLPRPTVTVGSGFRELEVVHGDRSRSFWNEGLRSACSSLGGNFVEDRFCMSSVNSDQVSFFVLRRQDHFKWYEPTGSPTAPGYWSLVRAAGFVTQAEHAERTRAAQDVRRQENLAEERRLAAEWPLMREVGVRVCKAEGNIRYLGFVEAFTDTRMKVMISQATLGRTAYRPGGFQPHSIWTAPNGWSVC